MKHVLGMAKSILDVKSGQRSRLEENFLKLERAIRTFEDQGERAHGHLLVLGESAEKLVAGWIRQRGLTALITVVRPNLTAEELRLLEQEKSRMRSRTRPSDSVAAFGGPLAEKHLRREIKARERGVKEGQSRQLGTNWDFSAHVRNDRPPVCASGQIMDALLLKG